MHNRSDSARINVSMEQLLMKMVGREIDVNCGASQGFRGEVLSVSDGVLSLKDEDGDTVHIAVKKIAAVAEVNDKHHRPGFIGK